MDDNGNLTIGYGYNIDSSNFISDFLNAGINLTQEQINGLNELIRNRNLNSYNSNPNSITINEEEADALYNTIIESRFEVPVLAKFNETRANELENTEELIALVSLAYNGGVNEMIGPNLTAAINDEDNDGDRVVAWYEIRYASNKIKFDPETGTYYRHNGIQNRRTAESDKFKLYDDESNVGDNEAKHVISFLEKKRAHITEYLEDCYRKGKDENRNYRRD